MTRTEGFLQEKIESFVERTSGWTVLAVALIFYPGLGLLLPVLLGFSRVFLIELNVVGVVFATVMGVGWLSVELKASERRRLLEWTSNLRLLDSTEFEWLVGEIFRREGWKVQETGRSDGPDGNIDLVMQRDGQRTIVQCKRWQSWVVSVDEIRNFAGTLMREKMSPESGIFVTLSRFSEQARIEATEMGIQLLDSYDLVTRIENVRRTEPCPNCGSAMLLGHSVHGWWMRCVAQGCKGKRNLSSEPGRALDLLTRH